MTHLFFQRYLIRTPEAKVVMSLNVKNGDAPECHVERDYTFVDKDTKVFTFKCKLEKQFFQISHTLATENEQK